MSDARGSGKQVFLAILANLSQRLIDADQLEGATGSVRAGLLLHGSTAEESYAHVSRLAWASEADGDGDIWRQGIATLSGVFLTDFVETLLEAPTARDHVLREHPALSAEDYEALEHGLWLVVSAVQMFEHLLPAEVEGELDLDYWVEIMNRKYQLHMSSKG